MSRKFLDNCLFSLNNKFRGPVGLSHGSRRDYHFGLTRMVRELHAGGIQISHITHFKPRHVIYLVKKWQESGVMTSTIKNRLSQLRFLSQLIRRPDLMPKLNKDLDVGARIYISPVSKAIHEVDLSKFKNLLIHYSVQLQQQFGLRREESIKFIASDADKGSHITLTASWTKGGIERNIPITNDTQRVLLDEIKTKINKGNSLIPADKTYAYQRRVYDTAVYKAGYSNFHGLRHAYAQRRYLELTHELTQGKGWPAPHQGGKSKKDMSPDERNIDRQARLILSNELGHSRGQITQVYLGN